MPPSGRTRVSLIVEESGPLFDGRAELAVREWLAGAVRDVAAMTDAELVMAMGRRFKHPTGHYASQTTEVVTSSMQRIVTNPVVYGPWLEGTSKRNESTRFKGYHLWRSTWQKMRGLATPIAQASLNAYIGRMN